MSGSKSFTKLCLLVVVHTLPVHPPAEAQQKPLIRVFVAGSEERYDVSITLRAQTQSVSTETVASMTYVMPEARSAEVRLKWRATRRILLIRPDGQAELEEDQTETQPCEDIQRPRENTDAKLQASLAKLCASLRAPVTMRYTEDSKGSLHEARATASAPDLGEEAPPLLALWLRRAARPSVVFPSLAVEAGARAKQELRPSGDLLKNAQGSESAEWLDAQSDTPAASLHVVQQLGWDAQARATARAGVAIHPGEVPRRENFFADSITTLSLLDGSVLRADRSASRTTSHAMEPVAGLPEPPQFSSKLSISVAIERLP